MKIRRAVESDSGAMSAMAMRSKAHWGYSQAQMDAWRDDLVITSTEIAKWPTYVAEIDGQLAGCYLFTGAGEMRALEHFWVGPACMGRGVGRALLAHAVAQAAQRGVTQLTIDADPNAEAFYLACGARRVGEIAAPIEGFPLRQRPQLVIAIGQVVDGMQVVSLDQRDPAIAQGIHAVQMAAYAQEARLLGAKYFAPLERTVEDILSSTDRFFGVFDDGVMVGATSIEPGESVDEFNIASLVVLPAMQRRGIGRSLLKVVIAVCDGARITVSTGAKNTPALALYAQFGFVECRRWFNDEEPLELVKLRRRGTGA